MSIQVSDDIRDKARTLKRMLLFVESEMQYFRDAHPYLKEARIGIVRAASKIEDYLRDTE